MCANQSGVSVAVYQNMFALFQVPLPLQYANVIIMSNVSSGVFVDFILDRLNVTMHIKHLGKGTTKDCCLLTMENRGFCNLHV